MDRDNVTLSIMMAFNIPAPRSLGENPDEHVVPVSLGPVIFVIVVASIVWMMYCTSGFKRFVWINAFARSAYLSVLRKAATEGDGQNGMANTISPKEDRELDEILWTLRQLKKEALNSESSF
jgi:hypothetical protein